MTAPEAKHTKPTTLPVAGPRELLNTIVSGMDDARARVRLYELESETSRRSQIRAAMAEMLEKRGWGEKYGPTQLKALARWALEQGIDPLRHIDLLGGRVYLNASYYYDELARRREELHVSAVEVVMLAPLAKYDYKGVPDPAMRKQLEEEEAVENARTLRLARDRRVPPRFLDTKYAETAAAAMVLLHFDDGRPPASGVNWAGSCGRKTKNGAPTDPIGDDHPVKTAVTRAFRKAAMAVVPAEFRVGSAGEALDRIEAGLAAERAEAKRQRAEHPEPEKELSHWPDEPYAKDTPPVDDQPPIVEPGPDPTTGSAGGDTELIEVSDDAALAEDAMLAEREAQERLI